ncbi:UDP-N-acetylglucosamine 2-epimerase (non-hydrolysing) [Lentzea xinjiangensis]|uniref:UDP-N-acetylglucosamine 2-epimerase (Non-hydrolysing) n=1 Tax=Lentzea xinjiangensis TaxID=402600 RepID=A0A1H9TQN5_9PSEU|nr:UDP-N-acetylglucosamine 2-epimerase [Lentzea xinjiangensis]SER99475.1 UDP-N-acetylglucosamine 2-epimerase (non-hydrolysing) [Lentzea xinjiangensis]
MTTVLQRPERAAVQAKPPRRRTPVSTPRPGGIAVVLGGRAEVFRLAPVLAGLGDAARVVRADRRLPSVPRDRSCSIAATMERLGRTFAADRPEAVVVHGASDIALAGALAADANDIPLVRVGAGLRSHDLDSTEEQNRVLIDRAARVLCAPTQASVANLRAEGLESRDVRLTGSTAVEAARHRLMAEVHRLAVVRRWGLEPDRYALATIDHPDNVDDEEALFGIMNQLAGLVDAGHPVVVPAHPRTRAAIERSGVLSCGMRVRVVDRLWHSEFLALAAHAGLLVTDSGAVQKEATVLKRPLLVARRSTECPEVLEDFGRAVGRHDDLTALALDWLADDGRRARLAELPSPFGDGEAGARIADAARAVTRPVVRVVG